MTEEKRTYEYIPENYEEDVLMKRRKSKVKNKDEGFEDVNINSLMDT